MLPFKKNYKKYALGYALFFIFTDPAQTLTLKEALQSALGHPQVLADHAALDASRAVIDQEKAAFYPSVDLAAQGGLGYVRDDYQQNALNSAQTGEVRNFQSSPSLAFKQLLYDGGATENQIQKAVASSQKASGRYLQTVDSMALDATTAYIDVMRLQKLKKITERKLAYHEAIFKKISRLVGTEGVLEGDQIQAKVRLDDVRVSLAVLQGYLNVATAVFIEIVGKAPDHLSPVDIPAPGPFAGLLPHTLQKNKNLQAAREDLQAAKAISAVSQAHLLPVVTFEASAQRDQNAYGTRGVQLQGSALVVLRYNLFAGGATRARCFETAERVTESSRRLAVQKREIERDVHVFWANLKSAEQQIASLRDVVKNKKKLIKTYELQRDKNLRSLLDFLYSVNDYYDSRSQEVEAEATKNTMKAKILAASSSLLEALHLLGPTERIKIPRRSASS